MRHSRLNNGGKVRGNDRWITTHLEPENLVAETHTGFTAQTEDVWVQK